MLIFAPFGETGRWADGGERLSGRSETLPAFTEVADEHVILASAGRHSHWFLQYKVFDASRADAGTRDYDDGLQR